MSRLPRLTPDQLTPEQRRLYDSITGGERSQRRRIVPLTNEEGALQGLFNAFLYSPEIGDAVQRLSSDLKRHTSLSAQLRELVILQVSRHWKSDYSWHIHTVAAAREGLSKSTIEAIEQKQNPKTNMEITTVYQFVSQLLETRRVSSANYSAAQKMLGQRGLYELVTLVGFYCLIACTLNSFEIAPPKSSVKPG